MRKQSINELEQVLHFLPPGLQIDTTTRKAVELSAKMAARSDALFDKFGEPPRDLQQTVYDFLSRRAYFNEINSN